MRHSWKQHAAAAAVTISVFTAYSYLVIHRRYARTRSNFLSREALSYDRHNNGIVASPVLSAFLGSIWNVAIAIVPYQLTLAAINSKRLSGED